MSENKTVGSMTERQRGALAALLSPSPGRPAVTVEAPMPFAFGMA
jgi:hypothetical protein